MKNKLALATLFLTTAMVAAGCDNDVTIKKDKGNDNQYIIFSLDKDGQSYKYYADDLLSEMTDSSSATTTLYDEVARQVFTAYAEATLDEGEKDSIISDAEDKVSDFKDDCKTTAKDEGEDYDDYLEDQLEELGVEDIKSLRNLYIYQGYKEAIEEDYIEDHYNYFLNEYLNTYTPFQVKHILVAANTADTSYADGTMSTDNARKLLQILNEFIDGESFANIAKLTDDTSSAADGGVMPFNEAQNYVSEFRFATYVQEIFANHSDAQERYDVAADLHIINDDEESSDYVSLDDFKDSNLYEIYDEGMGLVSLDDIMTLGNSITKDMKGASNYYNDNGTLKTGIDADDVPTIAEQTYVMNVDKYNCEGELNKNYYQEFELQRNKIFNKTLNSHKLQYIDLGSGVGSYASKMTTNKTTVKVNGVDHTVLADDSGNPIFVALASTGIHFMSMVWNSYNPVSETGYTSPKLSAEAKESLQNVYVANYNYENNTTKTVADFTEWTTEMYNEAYFTLYDSDVSALATNLENYKYTYIGQNGAYATKSSLTSASDDLLDDITSYVSNVEYYLFNALVYDAQDEGLAVGYHYDVTFTQDDADKTIYNKVKDMVTDKITSTNDSFESSVQSSAETYGAKLAREKEVKDAAFANWAEYKN